MTTLYNLSAEYKNAFDALNEMIDAGTLSPDEFNDNMAAYNFEMDSKIEACGMHAKNMKSEIEQLKKFKAEIDDRIKSLSSKMERFEDYIRFNMESVGKKQVKTPLITVSVGKRSASLEVLDIESIPDAFKKVEMVKTTTVYNPELKKALIAEAEAMAAAEQNGVDAEHEPVEKINGARIVYGKPSLTIKV